MELEKQLQMLLKKPIHEATNQELFDALMTLTKEKMATIPTIQGSKKLYYISAEFLIGKQLGKNLLNLGMDKEIHQILKRHGKQLADIEALEDEPSLGNGGLGRLAACFLDSIATLNLPGDGIGLNYHFGLFKQVFQDHKQLETPDVWRDGNTFLKKTDTTFTIQLAGKSYQSTMYDLDVIGYHGQKNTLHLFDLDSVDESIVKEHCAFDKTDIAKNLTLFLYPDDRDEDGKKLRIYQQYFMVSNAAQYILQQAKKDQVDLHKLDQHVAIQINDTHPSLIIPELIRLLTLENIPFKEASDIISNICAYTNHTILAEALEKWPLAYLTEVVPQLVPIIGGLDYAVNIAFKGDPNLTIIDQDHLVHMARMDMHFSHSINGVAALHTEILKHQELKPFYTIYQDKFNNKTNGITFRRWLMHANPKLANLIDHLIGDGYRQDLNQLESLLKFIDHENVLNQFDQIKFENKQRLANYLQQTANITIDPNSIYDIQIKRMHEYKRQQMNALWVIYQYLQIKNGQIPQRPITVIFGGKAAPAYFMAQNIIHLILCLQQLINEDPQVAPHIKVVMLENYNITKAELVIPACDISEQISLASKEASGTGNMKFMLNGAITLGTNDGANVEIRQLVGDENIYTFGKSSDEVIALYNTSGYHAQDYYQQNQTIRQCVDFITSPQLLAIGDEAMLKALQDNLMHKDWFMTLLDFIDYCAVKQRALNDYENRIWWKKKALVNIAKSAFFSSDRTIREYNQDIWKL